MNTYQLYDNNGHTYVVRSNADKESFSNLIYRYCCDNYKKVDRETRYDKEYHTKMLNDFIEFVRSEGWHDTELLQTTEEIHFWVWE